MGVGNAFKREEGWRQLGMAVTSVARAGHYDAIAAANRSVIAELTYYARPRAGAVAHVGPDATSARSLPDDDAR